MKTFLTTYKMYVFILAAFGLGIGATFLMQHFLATPAQQFKPLRESNFNKTDNFDYIDPLLAVNDANFSQSPDTNELEQTIRSFISSNINSGKLATASVVFIDEKNASGFTINPDEKYSPASLLKVPTLIAYYKLAEDDASVLSKKITYTGGTDYNLEEHIVSPVQLQVGTTYTVEELLEHLIKYSDNNAATLLINNLNNSNGDVNTFDQLFRDLGIGQIDLENDFITVRGYSLFFRILYNATYLDREWSEKALGLLTQTDFSKGIEAGIPNDIQVAQKFGEFTLQDQSGNLIKRELHDCGIVYYPSHPYLICVMTKGSDFTNLEEIISGISRDTFEYMEGKYTTK